MSLKTLDELAEELATPTQNETVEVEDYDEVETEEIEEEDPSTATDPEESSFSSEDEKIRFLSSQAANLTQPLMNMATRLIYEKVIFGGKTVEDLRKDLSLFKRKSTQVVDLDEAEYFSTVELVLFSFDQANIQPAEIEQLREALVPLVRYYTKQKPSPFAPIMMFVAAKFMPIILSGLANRGKMRRKQEPIEVEIIEEDEA